MGDQDFRPAPASEAFPWPTRTQWTTAAGLLAIVTLVVMAEQILSPASVPDLGDPLFSMWRLAWIAHQLPRQPWHLFDAPIFHPASHTLAYSDALPLDALVAAPWLWLGVPVVFVYTALVVTSFYAAALGMFALARAITNHTGAAVVAAIVFAFDPFRFAQYSHLESEWTCWLPLATLSLLRAFSNGRRRDGARFGLFVVLQAWSGLYMAAYFAVSALALAGAWVVVRRPTRRGVAAALLGILIAAGICGVSTVPYWISRSEIGERQDAEIGAFSGAPADYLTSSRRSLHYRNRLFPRQGAERELYPGAVSTVLAAAALLPPTGPFVGPVLVPLVVAVDASLGVNGLTYPWLAKLPGFRAFRVAARFRAIAGLYLAMLAAMSAARLAVRIRSPAVQHALLTAIAAAVIFDNYPSLELQPVWTTAPTVYAHVPAQAVIADLPMPREGEPQWHATAFQYFQTFHWRPTVNGYSGFAPADYPSLVNASRAFPADDALDAFARVGTEYFVLHEGFYHDRYGEVVASADRQTRLQFVAADRWIEGESRVYRLVR